MIVLMEGTYGRTDGYPGTLNEQPERHGIFPFVNHTNITLPGARSFGFFVRREGVGKVGVFLVWDFGGHLMRSNDCMVFYS